MEFQDTITPSFPEYVQRYVNPYGNGGLGVSQSRDLRQTWEQMYYPNAFQAALLNYQNEWQSPINQMLRYQEAGLNPYSFQAQSSASGSPGAKPEPSTRYQELNQKKISNVISAASSVSSIMGVAKELYDYINFGAAQQGFRTSLLSSQSEAANYDALTKASELNWRRYWNQGVDMPVTYTDSKGVDHSYFPSKSPRGVYMMNSTARLKAQVSQLTYMVNSLYPSQKDANDARAALTNYLKDIEMGKNDAVLNINTGNKNADAVLRFLVYLLKDNTGNLINSATQLIK